MLFFKRLELHGFKSFANKTTIEFLPGITVVVGPNGCGKSNVFDSIRWVLGEQSAKSMRGSRMGDVIFNGSANLKAGGMARVGLVLNNAQKHLPIDFDEVNIARRLFRTGESEYLLNGSQCRLKDIVNLCMDTGVGTDSYSVLEQGKVDAIITSKPLERRVIFDEAAGISKYKAKKEEALNKLERTDADLVRLADIIGMIKKQAGSLKRQANKAERYKRLTAELSVLEMELLVRRFFQLRESGAGTEELYARLTAEVTGLRDEMARLAEQEESDRAAADEVQAALDRGHSVQFEVNALTQEAQGRIALAEQRIATAGERRGEIAAEIEELARQAWLLGEDIARAEGELEQHREGLERLEAEYGEKHARHEAMKAEGDGATGEIQRLRGEINTATRAQHELDNAARLARAMEEKTGDELGRSETETAMLRQQVEALSAERDERHGTAEENDQVLAALRADLDATRGQLRSRETELGGATTGLEQARRDAHQCQSRHDALAEMQENYDGYFRGVRDIMVAARGGVLRGVEGVVSALIEADGAHELAIEVALGSQAQDIVVETAEDGKAAIRWLKQKGTGRATFLPLDLIEPREPGERLRQAASIPGVVGFATDLVRYEPRLEKAVRYLLGGVLVVESLDTAVELEREGVRTRFVTLDGDMLNAHGAMSGGSVKAAGLLHRTREIKELAAQLGELRAREQDLATRVDALRAEIAVLRETHEKLAAGTQSQELEAARTRKDFEALEAKLGDKTAQLSGLDARRGVMEAEIAQHRQVQERNSALLDEMAGKIRAMEDDLSRVEAQATAKQRELNEFSRELNDLAITMSATRERHSSMRDKLDSLRRDKVRVAALQTDRQGDIEDLKAQEALALEEIDGLKLQMEELGRRRAEVEQQITHETQRKETIQLDLHKLGEREQVLRRDLNESQNQLHEVELKRTEHRLQLDNIRVQASEKFGMAVEDVIVKVLRGGALPAAPVSLDAEDEDTMPDLGDAMPAAETADTAGAPAQDGELRIPVSAEEIATALAGLREPEVIAGRINEIREAVDRIGPVHVGAIDEYRELNERYLFLSGQEKDLVSAKTQLTETIRRIDETTTDLFTKAFAEIRENFAHVFRRLFGGGRADLLLTDENGVLDSGVDIVAQPPGKKPTHISQLSGGEKALTALSLLFAIFLRKPSPFCILDEVDAPLDDKNIERFKDLVREFARTTQFVIITHNKQTMALANTIYGVTMEEQGVSRVVSIRLDEIDDSDIVREAQTA
jgi:chromosome segregation protein